MSTFSEKCTLYVAYGFTNEQSSCSIDKNTHNDSYTVKVWVSLDELKDCGDGKLFDEAINRLEESFEYTDPGEVGYVTEEGWYEPPHYCYSDPAAACDADGETTSAEVSIDADEQSIRDDLSYAVDGIDKWEEITQEDYDKMMAIVEKIADKMAPIVYAVLCKQDGEDLL